MAEKSFFGNTDINSLNITRIRMQKQITEKPVLVIVGPTGVGKTAVSIEIARRTGGEIISADSRQIYRNMDVGTAKPPMEIRERIPHHFIDILEPDQEYSAGEFARQARLRIQEIIQAGKLALIVGGSGLYVRALLEGFFGEDVKNAHTREWLSSRLHKEGAQKLYKELRQVDPQAAQKIHPRNVKRLLRALEVYYLAGEPISALHKARKDPAPFPWIKFGLTMPRPQLYHRINQRVEEMFREGLIDEVKGLLESGYAPSLNALNSVGYKEVIAYLQGKMDLPECKELVKRNTRRYAKRQMTWFRADPDIHWITLSPDEPPGAIARKLLRQFEKMLVRPSGTSGVKTEPDV